MGTGNHEHRHDAFDDERCVLPGHRPCDERDPGGDNRHHSQQKRRAIRKRLRAGSRTLRLCDESHNPGKSGLVAGARHLDSQRPRTVDGSGDDTRAHVLADGA
jgi:hypothetical protein